MAPPEITSFPMRSQYHFAYGGQANETGPACDGGRAMRVRAVRGTKPRGAPLTASGLPGRNAE